MIKNRYQIDSQKISPSSGPDKNNKAMSEKDNNKQELIKEIRRRIEQLISTETISDAEKVTIARTVLNLIENGEKEKQEAIQ